VLDARDEQFWDRVTMLVRALQSLRPAILTLQSDSATMADVYANWVGIHSAHGEIDAADFVEEDTKDTLSDILQKRIGFLISSTRSTSSPTPSIRATPR
jgi:hypothetical protein